MALPGFAQSHDLGGQWSLQNKGAEVLIEMSPQGNAWIGKALSKTALDLKLNPAGLRNQWVGDLNYQGKHSVKAESKGKDTLLVTDLDDQQTWTLIRSK